MPLLLVFVISLFSACRDPEPDPIPASTECEAGFILDGSSCVPESCGTGRWGTLPVDDDTVYVDGLANEGGDGSEAAPYSMIQRGLNRAGGLGGGLVAVAAGVYSEALLLTPEHGNVWMAGRCREMVVLDGSTADDQTPGFTVDIGGETIEVSGIMVRKSYSGLWVESGTVEMRDSGIVAEYGIGVLAAYSTTMITLLRTYVKDIQSDSNGNLGRGVSVEAGATLSAASCLIDGNTEIGLYASDLGTEINLWDTVVRDTRPGATGESGRGISVQNGAKLFAEGCLIEDNSQAGLMLTNPGTQVTLQDTTIKDTQPDANGDFGWGISVTDGATLNAEGCFIDGNTAIGIFATNPETEVHLRGTTVKETQPDAIGDFGMGIQIQDGANLSAQGCYIDGNSNKGIQVIDGATFSAESCFIDGNTEVGLLVGNPGTKVILRETTVKDTQPDANGELGLGISVQDGAILSADGCYIEGNMSEGLLVSDPETEVIFRKTTVKDTQPNLDGEFGRGIEVYDGATLSAEGCLIDGNTSEGLMASNPGTEVTLRDTTVRDTRPNVFEEFGMGISVWDGATLSSECCLIERNSIIGLAVSDPGTEVTLRDTTVKDTQPNANGEGGRGIQVNDGATLSIEDCLIDGNTELGLLAIDGDTKVVLHGSVVSATRLGSGIISSGAFGLCVQSGAVISATEVVVASNQGPGLLSNGYPDDDALLSCDSCTIRGNQFAGALAVNGGALVVTDSIIENTVPSTNLLGGAGIYAWPWLYGPPAVILTNTIIQDNPVAGVWFIGDGTYVLTGNTISGGIGEPFGSGSRCGDAILARDGVKAWDGTSGLLLQDNVFQDASGSGVFLDGSSALMLGNTYSGNAVDLVVQNQNCDPIPSSYSEAPQRDLCPVFSYPTCYTEFFFAAMPADPVDWEKEKAAPRPFLVTSPARPIHSFIPATRLDPLSHPLLLPR